MKLGEEGPGKVEEWHDDSIGIKTLHRPLMLWNIDVAF